MHELGNRIFTEKTLGRQEFFLQFFTYFLGIAVGFITLNLVVVSRGLEVPLVQVLHRLDLLLRPHSSNARFGFNLCEYFLIN